MSGSLTGIRLGPRLSEIARRIPRNGALIDVGCDHGRLPVSLLLSGQIQHAIAVDLRLSPLKKAIELAQVHAVPANQFQALESNGLASVPDLKGKTIVIAGMGGLRIAKILRQSERRLPVASGLVLQPNTDAMRLRQRLSEIGFVIVDEAMCLDRGKRYTVIEAKWSPQSQSLTDREMYLGPVLSRRGSQIFREHCSDIYSFLVDLKKQLGPRFPLEKSKQLEWLRPFRLL